METRWLVKGLVESVFVVGSILMALAVDEWAQDREYAQLADQSLGIFEREIGQNRARVADGAPYHQGIRDLLAQMRELEEPPMDIRTIMDGLDPPVLLSTAWETALATGALTYMDFEVVSALSMTYSIQDDFEERSRVGRPRFTAREVSAADKRIQAVEAHEYVMTLARDEAELLVVFDQALELIASRRSLEEEAEAVAAQPDESGPGG